MERIIIGIDVSKDRLDVAVRPSGEAFVVERNARGLAELVARLRTLAPDIVALEATGGFETVVAAALAGAGLPVAIVNPAHIRAFARALGKRAKTDPIDAAVIAHFAEATGLTPRPLADEATRLLADLVARRRQIVEMIGAERQREQRMTGPRLKKSIGPCAVHGGLGRQKTQPLLKAFFDRLVAAGKPKMVALIAVARKLLTILNAIIRDNRPWQTA